MGIQSRYRALLQHNVDLTLLIMDLVNQLGGEVVVPSIMQMEKLYASSFLNDQMLPAGEHRLSLGSIPEIGGETFHS